MARFPPQFVCPHNPNMVHEGLIVQADDKSGLWVEAVTGHDSSHSWQVEKLWLSADKTSECVRILGNHPSAYRSSSASPPLIVIHYHGKLHQELLSVSKRKYTVRVEKREKHSRVTRTKKLIVTLLIRFTLSVPTKVSCHWRALCLCKTKQPNPSTAYW